ncbi:unnamed protein product [Phytomonas sp. Hart1]|nr:unnamed protein product [Phytomonas sp. Hart1]|eukprot:CCW67359.1 unnamed protein product [Phytomonas sp. isolate Hart1]
MCGILFSLKQRFYRKESSLEFKHDTNAATLMTEAVHELVLSPTKGVTTLITSCSHELHKCEDLKNGIPLDNENMYEVRPCRSSEELWTSALPCGSGPYKPTAGGVPHLTLSSSNLKPFDRIVENIRRRGPDNFGVTKPDFPDVLLDVNQTSSTAPMPKGVLNNNGAVLMQTKLEGVASVLGLRGRTIIRQPYEIEADPDQENDGSVSPNKSFLLMNGEIFNGSMHPPPWGSDTIVLANRLSQLEQEYTSRKSFDSVQNLSLAQRQRQFLTRCVDVIESEVQGQYSFAFYAHQLQMIVFGRDPLGRVSLLLHFSVHTASSPPISTPNGGLNDDNDPTRGTFLMGTELLVSSVGAQHTPLHSVDAVKSNNFQSGVQGKGSYSVEKRKRDVDRSNTSDDDDEEHFKESRTTQSVVVNCDITHCWTEVPVTGLLGLPLDKPFLPLSSWVNRRTMTEHDEDTLDTLQAQFMHSPWRDVYHFVHPLLRAQVAAEAAGANNFSASSMVPIFPKNNYFHYLNGENSKMLLDMLLPLPPLLAERVASSSPKSDSNDDVWAHRAAILYLHSLTSAVMRRTHVACSGAEDGRNPQKLAAALRRPLCILFSGGIDSAMLAALAHFTLPIETPIELVNVTFGEHSEQAPDRVTALQAVEELLRLPQGEPHGSSFGGTVSEREWRLVFVDVPSKYSAETPHLLDLVMPQHTVMDMDIGTAFWHASRAKGRMQRLYHNDIESQLTTDAAACLNEKVSPHRSTNGLENYSKHFRVLPGASFSKSQVGPASDRLPIGLESEPLSTPFAANSASNDTDGRFDILVEVLVTEGRQRGGSNFPVLLSVLGKEYRQFLHEHLSKLGYKKLGSFLSDAARAGVIRFVQNEPSKAVVLVREEDRQRASERPPQRWFQTNRMKIQQGCLQDPLPPEGTYELEYNSTAKVILLGTGADETLGGYTRYRRLYNREGINGARRELEEDFSRFWKRNLGRDDRITMDNGREPRFPYLDEEVLRMLEHIVWGRRSQLLQERQANLKQQETIDAGAATVPLHPAADDDQLLQASIAPVMSLELGAGEGDKRVLRHAAAIVGLQKVACLQKRAIQFGSRIAERRIHGSKELHSTMGIPNSAS